MPDFIRIENDGPKITATNYWQTEHAKRGYVYLSINAGCFRLLVPKGRGIPLDDMRVADIVLVSRGPWTEAGKPDALEILFEDRSENPFCLHIVPEQCDRLPVERDRDRKGTPPRWMFSVYNEDGFILEIPARYRIVKRIPWLKGWDV